MRTARTLFAIERLLGVASGIAARLVPPAVRKGELAMSLRVRQRGYENRQRNLQATRGRLIRERDALLLGRPDPIASGVVASALRALDEAGTLVGMDLPGTTPLKPSVTLGRMLREYGLWPNGPA